MNLTEADVLRIKRAAAYVETHDTDQVLAELFPDLTETERTDISSHLAFDHTAVLVFPDTLEGLREELDRLGFEPGAVNPSVVVRGRLARRYGSTVAESPVAIVHLGVAGRSVEIFALPVPPDSPLEAVAADERESEHEAHHAFAATEAPVRFEERTGAVPDGGGYNAHERVTVRYFRTRSNARFELRLSGDAARGAGNCATSHTPPAPGRAQNPYGA
ncbi:hypothetical protein ACIQI8_13525 [Streptomyces sp. NPDC092369]|uniref:hypothetical protein n=1 Tax=Streptomyces sp. NPDC092369 TaxID=3366015 RepID=UPI00380CF834